MPARIRLALQPDLPVVAALTLSAYARHTAMLGAAPLPVTEDYGPRIARGEVHILEDDNGATGLLVLEDHRDHSLIFSVAIVPDRQGEGLGRLLLKFAERTTRERGQRELRLYTNGRFEKNIALYASLGYRETGRRAHPSRAGWIVVDMVKQLD